jgi:hypothetical protein
MSNLGTLGHGGIASQFSVGRRSENLLAPPTSRSEPESLSRRKVDFVLTFQSGKEH